MATADARHLADPSEVTEDCAICLDPVSVHADVCATCGSHSERCHSFHLSCLQQLLARDSRCPICRQDFSEVGYMIATGSSSTDRDLVFPARARIKDRDTDGLRRQRVAGEVMPPAAEAAMQRACRPPDWWPTNLCRCFRSSSFIPQVRR
mmetsp:Transcript_197/g.362  ORF Transcript_197/g.362 Transcript_197/m.362 type:complete len:150 (-) Transcript_197:28-477(-)